ncbi:hypothetical protein GCM10022261_12990 [Brevibacterium daeguense]|uniref:Carboxypeptidase regulatory-like domain-containing protein n=1 Tax=Brevibacterium daeguense TaxID=909936 RepID=A0ABP8EIH2_9MICO|nr:hypothetical protein [Brevibacterium daeguense]
MKKSLVLAPAVALAIVGLGAPAIAVTPAHTTAAAAPSSTSSEWVRVSASLPDPLTTADVKDGLEVTVKTRAGAPVSLSTVRVVTAEGHLMNLSTADREKYSGTADETGTYTVTISPDDVFNYGSSTYKPENWITVAELEEGDNVTVGIETSANNPTDKYQVEAKVVAAEEPEEPAEPVFPKVTTSDITYTEGDDEGTITISGTATPEAEVTFTQFAIMTTSGHTYYIKSDIPEVIADENGEWTLELPLSTTFGAQYRDDVFRQLSNTDDTLDEVVTGDTLSIIVSAAGKGGSKFISLTVEDAPEEPEAPAEDVVIEAPEEITREDLTEGFEVSGTNATGEHITVSVHPTEDDSKPTTFRFPGDKTEWAKTYQNIKNTEGLEAGDTLTVEVRNAKGDTSVIATETITVVE